MSEMQLAENAAPAVPLPDTLPAEAGGEELAGVTGDTEQTVAESDADKSNQVIEEQKERNERKLSGIQKRIDELTRDKYTEREARQALERQNNELLALLKGGQTPAKQAQSDDGRPKQDQFTDYADFVRADAVWTATQATKQLLAQDREEATKVAQREFAARQQAETQSAFAQRSKEAAKSLPDFDEVMKDADTVQLPNHALGLIAQMESGPTIAYHMVKNPALAQKFFGKTPEMQAIMLGELSATLKSSAKVSTAPPPGKTASSKAGSSSDPPEDTDAYMAWAAKNMR